MEVKKNMRQDNELIFHRSKSTIWGKDTNKRTNLLELNELLKKGIKFKVIRTSDNKDVTTRILDLIRSKIWTNEEIDILKENYGKITLNDLRQNFLSNKSIGQIRHKANDLSLTIDKTWQEHELRALTALRKSGVSYTIISEILQRPPHAVNVKANKLGLVWGGDVGHNANSIEEISSVYKNIPALHKGKIAEDKCSIKLTELGFTVFLPYTPQHETDLIVIEGNKVAKLQIKSAVYDSENGRYRVPLTRKHAISHQRRLYDEINIDFFIFVCPEVNAYYVIPYSLCKKHKEAHLYPHRVKMIRKGFDWEMYRESFDQIKMFFERDLTIDE